MVEYFLGNPSGTVGDFLRRQVPPKPYDAEVEYIESTGTQYIDTGIVPFFGTQYNCTFKQNDISKGNAVYAVASDDFSNYVGFGVTNNSTSAKFRWFPNYTVRTTTAASDGLWHTSTMNLQDGDQSLLLDGTQIDTYNSPCTMNANLSLILFGRKAYSGNLYLANCCVSSFSIVDTSTGAELIHLLPVRVGQVGYMYDLANPTGGPLGNGLYPNAGSGEFILGDDA